MTRCALGSAELDVCLQLDNHVVKSSAQVIYGGRAALEPLQVQIQPKPDMIDAQVSQLLKIRCEVRNPLRVRYGLTRSTGAPRLEQGHKMPLNFGQRNFIAVRDNKADGSIIAFHNKVSVKVLVRTCQSIPYMMRTKSDLQWFKIRFNLGITCRQSDGKEGGE